MLWFFRFAVFSLFALPIVSSAQFINIYEGVVRFPNGFFATGNEQIIITARGSQFSNPTIEEFPVVVPEGADQGAFAFTLDSSQTGGFWSLSVRCEQCASAIPAEPHFPTTATGDPLILDPSSQFFYIAGTDFRALSLSFIATRPPSNPEAARLVPLVDLILNDDN